MTTAIAKIPNPYSGTAEIVVFDDALVGRVADVLRDLAAAPAVTATTVAECDALNKRAQKTEKEVDAAREAAKRPVLDLGKLIDAAAKSYADPIATERKALANTLGAYDAQVRAEAAAKAQAEAEERRRIALEAARAAEAAAAARAAEVAAETDFMDDLLGDDDSAEAAQADAAHAARVVAMIEAAPVIVTAPIVGAGLSSVKKTTTKQLVIDDATMVPLSIRGASGAEYVLRPIDESALRRALIDGAQVPGARLEIVSGFGAK